MAQSGGTFGALGRTRSVTRHDLLGTLDEPFDVLVIGGGATGLGTALDAVARGYRTALVESSDFAKATSSRSTKLVHGGVRYLQNGDVGLVREALHERANMRANAPHLVDELAFVLPFYRWYEGPYYFAGLKAYDALAGKANFHPSTYAGRATTLERLPDLKRLSLSGSIRYYDAQFDDARLALAIARTALDRGATVLNYVRAERFLYAAQRCIGALVRDVETGTEREIRAKVTVNATGIFVDDLRRLDDPRSLPLLAHSRGSHVVFAKTAFRGDEALIVPRTFDGRVLFAVPWHGHVVVGTTDIPVETATLDVAPTHDEIAFIIDQLNVYLERPVTKRDALAAFAGLRPLVSGPGASTAKLSREHLVDVSASGIVTVTGGKWTTYRKMAEDTVDVAALEARLAPRASVTERLALHGSPGPSGHFTDVDYAGYGTDRDALLALERDDPSLAEKLDARLPYTKAEVVFAARHEYARTVDDVLSRRTRASFIDADAARSATPAVAALLARELERDDAWQDEQRSAFASILAPDVAAFA
jgi:glycerol-3-phosphate dehydrogenase